MGRSATGDEARRVPWFNPTGIQKKQSPVWFHVFWQLCRKCARKMRSHLRRCQRLLFFGTAAGLEQSRIDDHLSKPPLVDDPTAHLLPGKKLIQAQVSHHIKHGPGPNSSEALKNERSGLPLPVGSVQEGVDGGSRASLLGLNVRTVIRLVAVTG